MPDPWTKIVVLRAVGFLLAALVIALSHGCKGGSATPPPLAGRCEPAEYSRTAVTAVRCAWRGQVWECHTAGDRANTCSLISSVSPWIGAER